MIFTPPFGLFYTRNRVMAREPAALDAENVGSRSGIEASALATHAHVPGMHKGVDGELLQDCGR